MIPVSERIPYQPGMAGGTWKSQRSTVIRCCGFERAAFDGRRLASPHSRRWRRSAPAPAPGPWCRRSGIGATCPIDRGRRRLLGRAILRGACAPGPHRMPSAAARFSALVIPQRKLFHARGANYQSLGQGLPLSHRPSRVWRSRRAKRFAYPEPAGSRPAGFATLQNIKRQSLYFGPP